MGVEAQYQAIPENSELLQRARRNREIAEALQFFNQKARGIISPYASPLQISIKESIQQLVHATPGLAERYFPGTQKFDAILYLLSPTRRNGTVEQDSSLIAHAINGSELLQPNARATQGTPIGFVPAHVVPIIADYLDTVTHEQLHEYYDPTAMHKIGVYKMHASDDEQRFESIWKEFTGMKDVYRQAAIHGEAMIIVID